MVVAGEASGDLHAGKVICAIKRKYPDIEIFGVGGERMKKCGMEAIYDISEISLMGFVDVVKNFRKLVAFENLCKFELLRRRPNAVLLVDYPGFNLRFAKFAKENGFKVFYYIAPQVWAWGRRRVKILKDYVDKLFVIFGFEVEFFKNYGIKSEFVGHPLLEDIREIESESKEVAFGECKIAGEKIVSFFPGSRLHEVKMMLETMIEAGEMIRKKLGVKVVFSKAKTIEYSKIEKLIRKNSCKFEFVEGSLELLKFSHLSVVKSGTTSLEAGLLGVPMVVCYKTSLLNYLIGRMLVKTDVIESIALPNILLREKVVPELIQSEFTKERIFSEVKQYLENESLYYDIKNKLLSLRQILAFESDDKSTSEIVAEKIIMSL